jgi:integrase
MSYDAVPSFMARLRERSDIAARALEFAILTASRSGEVRFATPAEFDRAAKTWTISASRMKSGRQHIVPLSGRAVEIIAEMLELGGKHVFPGRALGTMPLSDIALRRMLHRMGGACTVHGFRSSFCDWAGDQTPFPREVAEAALAHVVGGAVEQAYRRSSALEKRRQLMEAWADYCAGPAEGKVVALQR